MQDSVKKKIYIIGHKNPDTDSICSAIAYADIKNRTEEELYVAKRAGQISQETQYVLDRFHMDAPGYVPNVGTRVKDMDIRRIEGVDHSISLKKAWNLMRTENVNTLPIVLEGNELEGLITIGDIAQSYMDVYDNAILSTARTQYKNILETLDGTMVVGNEHAYFVKGKVVIAAANPDLMENYIEEDDLVILGNRYESQLCAIEMRASCIIVCEGAPVSKTIQRLAEERVCVVISTPHDTYTVARLINQSMPVKFFMKKDNLKTFHLDDYTDEIKDIMAKKRDRDFPILDKNDRYVGMVSRRNLLGTKRRRVILVDHNEASQAVDNIESAEILEIIDHHRLGSLETMAPVYFRNQPVGCTGTIMYQIYTEKNLEIPKNIAGLLCAAIISDTLMFRSPTCTAADRNAAENLARIAGINVEEFAAEMFAAGSNLRGKSPEEIFYQDFKKFEVNKACFGVGQINSMNPDELKEIKERLIPYMEKALGTHGESMLFFMLTDIIHQSTELLCYGGEYKELVGEAFHREPDGHSITLPGVVSRKKQLIPAFMSALQQ
ncbi:MAG TPA: putative manganese-dependent inorganic diphosphatase [Candidatus Limivivens merdigallinarum]|uniref:inorganic diphosphatase n=1 Tax=Candidatus Limivivens merdigallinarum TaxID=2840859 RepID=A0A9D0ZWJ1_9FIRM|nr:putative manganese-dependent inorganic diphosphatase [Candidatus Limivivens merdigallinarum]